MEKQKLNQNPDTKQEMIGNALHLLYQIYGYPDDLFPLWSLLVQHVMPGSGRTQAYVPTYRKNGEWTRQLGITHATYYRKLDLLQQCGAIRPTDRTGWELCDLTQKDWDWGYAFDRDHSVSNIFFTVSSSQPEFLALLQGEDGVEATLDLHRPGNPHPVFHAK